MAIQQTATLNGTSSYTIREDINGVINFRVYILEKTTVYQTTEGIYAFTQLITDGFPTIAICSNPSSPHYNNVIFGATTPDTAFTAAVAVSGVSGGGVSGGGGGGVSGGDIRASRISAVQTINTLGQVTAATYTFADGRTITDTFTFGSNSITEPTGEYRGNLVGSTTPTTSPILNSFVVSATGLLINYNTSVVLTTATATATINGVSSALTFNGSGQFAIGQVNQGDVVTISVSATTPASTAITNASVNNGSTFVPATGGLTLRTLNWSTTSGTTTTSTTVTASNGGSRSFLMDFTKDFELIFNDINTTPPNDSGIYIGFAPGDTDDNYTQFKLTSLLGLMNYFAAIKMSPLDVSVSPDLIYFNQNTVIRISYIAGVVSLARLVSNTYVDIAIPAATANCLAGKPAAYLKLGCFSGVNTYNIQLKTT